MLSDGYSFPPSLRWTLLRKKNANQAASRTLIAASAGPAISRARVLPAIGIRTNRSSSTINAVAQTTKGISSPNTLVSIRIPYTNINTNHTGSSHSHVRNCGSLIRRRVTTTNSSRYPHALSNCGHACGTTSDLTFQLIRG